MNAFRSYRRINQIELGVALASLVVAIIAGIYLAVTTFAAHETCYGISASKILCHPITSDTLAQTSARIALVLSIVLALYVAGAAAALGQARARHSDARVSAYMALVTCAVTVLAINLAALEGVGVFFLPSSLLLIVAALIGLPALLQANSLDATRSHPTSPPNPTPDGAQPIETKS